MKIKTLTATFLILALSQTACLTTVHTRPYHHDNHHYGHHGHHGHHTVHVQHPRPVYVPVRRPHPTIVTIRRY